MTQWVTACAAAYLIGSIPFAFVAGRLSSGVDLRTAGSGNVGAANLLRLAGWHAGTLAALLDAAKGAGAVWLVQRFTGDVTIWASAAVAAVLGHVYPVWLQFRGGKGVATAAGVFAVLVPVAAAAALGVFLVVVTMTRYVSLGSILSSLVLAPAALVGGAAESIVLAAFVTAVIVIERHRGNLRRLMKGTERRLGERARVRGGRT